MLCWGLTSFFVISKELGQLKEDFTIKKEEIKEGSGSSLVVLKNDRNKYSKHGVSNNN